VGLLTGDCAMVILHLFGFHAGFAHRDAALEAGVATTAVTGEPLHTVERRNDTALYTTCIESLVGFEYPVDLDQHRSQPSR
jgi:hypothetical protein